MGQNYYYQEIRCISSKIRGLAYLIKASQGASQSFDLNDVCYGLGSLLAEQVDALQTVANQIEADDLLRHRIRKPSPKK